MPHNLDTAAIWFRRLILGLVCLLLGIAKISAEKQSQSRGRLLRVISARYKRGPIILTFKKWRTIFNSDYTINVALLDRLLNHGHTVVLEGSSHCIKDRHENSCPATIRDFVSDN